MMKKNCSVFTASFLLLAGLIFSCSPQVTPWTEFTRCSSNDCVSEAIAVKDAFLKNPGELLGQFDATYQKGDDHVIGWLYLLRDSVLLNRTYGSTDDRMTMQQAIVNAAKPYQNDTRLSEMARSVIDEIGNLAIELEDNQPESLIPASGIYRLQVDDNAGSGELLIQQLSSDSMRFKLTIVGAAPAHNQGTLEGVALLEPNNSAIFTTQEYGGTCTIQFSWTEEAMIVKTINGNPAVCGLGQGVTPDGQYERISYEAPFLSKADARAVANLLGEWQSSDDPKSGIKITDGRYWDLYEGNESAPAIFIFYRKCPADCEPVGNPPCLKIIAQDEVCYAIIKADGQTLALSQIGGTGNTIVYKKK